MNDNDINFIHSTANVAALPLTLTLKTGVVDLEVNGFTESDKNL